jgi:homoserine kinase
MRPHVTVRVPGSTSNLGSGFDCVGLAVPRWLTLTVEPADRSAVAPPGTIERHGTVAGLTTPLQDDLLYRGFVAAARVVGKPVPPVALRVNSEIPVARGLGSSAAAVVAGAVAASALLELDLSDAALAELGTEIEGHPDNVAPMVHGGATLVLPRTGVALTIARLAMHESLVLVFAVPDFTVETKRARAALPATLAHPLAAEAAARAAALVYGLAHGDPRALAAGLEDVLHVPFRKSLVQGYDDVVAAALGAGAFGATLSGSGPTIVAVAPEDRAAVVGDAMRRAWDASGVRTESFSVKRPATRYELL